MEVRAQGYQLVWEDGLQFLPGEKGLAVRAGQSL